jgi:Caudovirus prohead serine protease
VLETAYPRPILHRAANGGCPELYGHFARWGEWTEIDSAYEALHGKRRPRGVRALDARAARPDQGSLSARPGQFRGDKPLGPIRELREDRQGAYYEVPLLNASYVADIAAGVEEGLYGASFRFRVMREEFVENPARSDRNPGRLPERTLREVELYEFGPVTFPAYDGATAGLRGQVRDSNATPKRGRPNTVITPRKRMEVKRRDGRVVEVLTPGRDRFSLDHHYVRANPGFFTTLPAATAETRAALRRMQARPGHTRARTSLTETLYGLAPRSRVGGQWELDKRRVLPSRTRTTRPVLPRRPA